MDTPNQPDDLPALVRDLITEVRALVESVRGHSKPLLTVDEFATLTGRVPFTVRRWIKQKKIHAKRVQGTGPKGRLLVPREELDKIIEDGKGATIPAVSRLADPQK